MRPGTPLLAHTGKIARLPQSMLAWQHRASLYRQTVPSLQATGLQHPPAVRCGHACTESMFTTTLQALRLPGTFHVLTAFTLLMFQYTVLVTTRRTAG